MISSSKILTGSSIFFETISGFKPHDVDYIILVEDPSWFKDRVQMRSWAKKECQFFWRKMSVNEYITIHLTSEPGMSICKFLTPEFAKVIGMTIQDLCRLHPMLSKLDDKHKYLKIIYDSYIENNDFYLTEDQRNKAYEEYKKYRKWVRN